MNIVLSNDPFRIPKIYVTNKTASEVFGKKLNQLMNLVDRGVAKLTVHDTAFLDDYVIRMERTTLGLGILCRLNGKPCYQIVDSNNVGHKSLYEVINMMSGGVVADKYGFIEQAKSA